jgi:lipoprotein-releasing system permease protein
LIWQFAFRYFIAKKSTNAINIIAWVSIVAIAVGTAALIVVLSVFNGFEDLVKSLYSSFYPPIKAMPAEGKTILVPPDKLRALHALPIVKDISEVAQEKASLRYNNQQTIAIIKGVDSNYRNVTGMADKIVRGTYEIGDVQQPDAIVGLGIEAALNIDVKKSYYPLTVYIPSRTVKTFINPEQALHVGNIDPVGTFAIEEDFNNTYVITNIGFMREMLELKPDEVSALEISLQPGADMNQARQQIQQVLGKNFKVQTRYEQNSELYSVMQTEKWAVYAILSFILIIAAFNMVGSLSMLVIEKEKDITILKAMGATNVIIRRIYLAEGLLIAGVGTSIGLIIAVLICLGQQHFGWVKLGGGTFVVDDYPVSMQLQDFILVVVTIFVIALLASIFPAQRAASQQIDLKS